MSIRAILLRLYTNVPWIKHLVNTAIEGKIFIGIKRKVQKSHSGKWAYLVLTPSHGNLGDHAIALSEEAFLNECGIPYCELTGEELELMKKRNCLSLMNGHPIIINGGGNLGDLWPEVEKLIQAVVRNNPDSTITIMPSSIYYRNEKSELWKKSIEVYNGHFNLTMFARESISYEYMQKLYDRVELAPDMVMALDQSDVHMQREGCLVCLRRDNERTISDQNQQCVVEVLEKYFPNAVRRTDTVLSRRTPPKVRRKALNAKWDEFRSAKLVVTDRLHGMVFCAITGTPCIVLNSESPKVMGCYRWINDLPYIRTLQTLDDVRDQIEELLGELELNRSYTYNAEKLKVHFSGVGQVLVKIREECR